MSFRRATFLKFSLCIWAICLGYSGGFFAWELFGQRADFAKRRTQELEHHLLLVRDRLNEPQALVEVLRHGLRGGDIDFFGWRKGGEWVSLEGHRPASVEHAREGVVAQDDSIAVARLGAGGGLELYFGSGLGWKARAREVVNHRFSFVLKEVLFFAVALMVLAVFFFQEMARTLSLRTETARAFRPKQPQEPKALRKMKGPAAAPSPRFEGGLVFCRWPEVDSLGAAEKIEQKAAILAELARRYGGQELEAAAIGRAYLLPSPELALAFARDCRLPAYLSRGGLFRLSEGRCYGKALSEGWARLGALPGDDLYKSKGSGFSEVKATDRLEEALAAGRRGAFGPLTHFRSDDDLRAIVAALAVDWPREHFLGALAELRSFSCLSTSKPLVEAYVTLLRHELTQRDTYRVSAVLALATHLFAAGAVSRDMERLFLQVLSLPDRRTKANAIEVFIHFFPDREIPELKPYLRDMDNRVSANALVKAALERFDEKVVRKIEERLKGGSVAHVASALYAVGEIAVYYRRTDPLYLSTKVSFLSLCGGIPEWVRHPNPMVKRQALVAARKLGDEKIDHRLRDIFEMGGDADLDELFSSVYGWRRKGERAA